MHDSAYSSSLLKIQKYFKVLEIFMQVKHFSIFPRESNCRILIGLCIYVFMNHSIMILDRGSKAKLLVASFFLELL